MRAPLGNTLGAPGGSPPPGSVGGLYTTRGRRLSPITRAPCRMVMGAPGQRSQAGGKGSECNLVVLDASDVFHDAFTVNGPRIDAEREVRSGFHAIGLTSSLPS